MKELWPNLPVMKNNYKIKHKKKRLTVSKKVHCECLVWSLFPLNLVTL